ncbi:ATP-binding cassette domain-containing protein [Pararhodobacter sp. CCB-MM2]|uniref:ATP-binding cassette domain-containing protein n=1 Tax=Pararhodobacter sp. CCB-MM2 TaxID=1786003 RepID=UPI00082A5F44|nr:ATP-binding cassette domain-containing protein [Pararhodobacter sp. CCB-MM2]
MSVVLSLSGVSRAYPLPRRRLLGPRPMLQALSDASLTLSAGETLGIVGESGSGKSTLARLVMGFDRPDAGRITVLGQDINALPAPELRRLRAGFQMVFQDPFGSLDPRRPVGWSIAEPLLADPALDAPTRRKRVAEALEQVGLRPADGAKFPHQFSGGQRQRVAIARGIVTRPRLLVADEPVSALDVSMQGQILNLLSDLQAQMGLAMLFISHDLALVAHQCDRVAVMHRGRIVESGPVAQVFSHPRESYTRSLLARPETKSADNRELVNNTP